MNRRAQIIIPAYLYDTFPYIDLPERLSFWHGMGLSRCGHQRRPKAECTGRPCIFSWPMMISNSVNEFFVAV